MPKTFMIAPTSSLDVNGVPDGTGATFHNVIGSNVEIPKAAAGYTVFTLSDPVAGTVTAAAAVDASISSFSSAFNSANDAATYSFAVATTTTTVVVGVSARASAANGLNSVTIGGVTATLIGNGPSSDTAQLQSFWYATGVPSGSVTVDLTFSIIQSRVGIFAWSLSNANPAGAGTVAGSLITSGGTTIDGSVNTTAGGLVLAVFSSVNNPNVTWTGITQRLAWTNFGDTYGAGTADALTPTGETPRTISFAFTSGTSRMLSAVAIPKA